MENLLIILFMLIFAGYKLYKESVKKDEQRRKAAELQKGAARHEGEVQEDYDVKSTDISIDDLIGTFLGVDTKKQAAAFEAEVYSDNIISSENMNYQRVEPEKRTEVTDNFVKSVSQKQEKVILEQEESEEDNSDEFDFELDKAIIYSEILNRKYF